MANINDRPVCFIAMAFDHADTDYIYEKQILPVLKRNGIKPIIINRQQSNDDLNIQIIEQLQKADFCITDLTYTRPSVYFEAGYAQRTIPVIYTVRKDHLYSGQPDHLRVHFDLQMKPLIVWKSCDDPTFANRLEQRIKKTFLGNWNKNRARQEKRQKAIEEFSALPLIDRLKIMRHQTIKQLEKLGYSFSIWGERNLYESRNNFYGVQPIKSGAYNYMNAYKIAKNVANYASIQSFLSITKKDIYYYYELYSERKIMNKLKDVSKEIQKTPLKIVHQHHIFLSIKPVTEGQLASIFEGFKPLQQPLRFYNEFSMPRVYEDKEVLVKSTYYFLTGIKSQINLSEQLEFVQQQIVQQI